jgi:malate synthase
MWRGKGRVTEVIAVRRKHTSGLRLQEELAAGLHRYLEYVGRLVDGIGCSAWDGPGSRPRTWT